MPTQNFKLGYSRKFVKGMSGRLNVSNSFPSPAGAPGTNWRHYNGLRWPNGPGNSLVYRGGTGIPGTQINRASLGRSKISIFPRYQNLPRELSTPAKLHKFLNYKASSFAGPNTTLNSRNIDRYVSKLNRHQLARRYTKRYAGVIVASAVVGAATYGMEKSYLRHKQANTKFKGGALTRKPTAGGRRRRNRTRRDSHGKFAGSY